MVKNEKGNILCRNSKGKEHYLHPSYIANKALMERYGWVIVEEPQAPPVSVDEAITQSPAEVVAAMGEPLEKPKRTRKRKLNQAA